MTKQKGIFGVYFLRGAFFHEFKNVGNDVVAYPFVSKSHKQLEESIGGTYDSLEKLLISSNGTLAKNYIEKLDFDYMVIGHGDSCSYYIHTVDGLIKCEFFVQK